MFQCDCPPQNCARWVELYLQGDRGAGDLLVDKFTPLIYRIVQRVLGAHGREEWEDATQAVLLHLFGNLSKWGNQCPFCKWLAVVAARRAIDLNRLHQVLPRLPEQDLADPRLDASQSETLELINHCISTFPPEWQLIWEKWIQGESREEMARELGKSVRTIQYWLAEMLDQVRRQLRDP